MFIILGDICFESLPEGGFSKRRLTAEAARGLIPGKGAPLTGCFDFGAVPSPRRDRDFRDLISGLRDHHDIDIDPAIFFSRLAAPDQDQESPSTASFPIPPQLARLYPDRPLLVVSYAFTMQKEKRSVPDDPLSWLRVCPETITFHLLECIALPE